MTCFPYFGQDELVSIHSDAVRQVGFEEAWNRWQPVPRPLTMPATDPVALSFDTDHRPALRYTAKGHDAPVFAAAHRDDAEQLAEAFHLTEDATEAARQEITPWPYLAHYSRFRWAIYAPRDQYPRILAAHPEHVEAFCRLSQPMNRWTAWHVIRLKAPGWHRLTELVQPTVAELQEAQRRGVP